MLDITHGFYYGAMQYCATHNPFATYLNEENTMNTVNFDQFNKLSMSTYETLKQLYTINTNTVEQLIEQQFALATLGVEYATNQMKLAGTAKGYKDVITAQTDLAGEISSKMQGIARNTMDIMTESKDEISTWFEKTVKEAEKGIKEVSKVVPVAKAA
jgi:phasin family protein